MVPLDDKRWLDLEKSGEKEQMSSGHKRGGGKKWSRQAGCKIIKEVLVATIYSSLLSHRRRWWNVKNSHFAKKLCFTGHLVQCLHTYCASSCYNSVVPKCCLLASNPCIEGIFRIIFITKEDEPQKLIEATEATSDSYPELILLLALLPSHQ